MCITPFTQCISIFTRLDAEVFASPFTVAEETTETPGASDTAVAALSVQGNTDDLDAIEADVNSTNLDSVNEYTSQM